MLAVVLSTGDLVAIGGLVGTPILAWATFITKMLWDIRTDVSTRSARQDQRLDDLEADVSELQGLLPRVIPRGESPRRPTT